MLAFLFQACGEHQLRALSLNYPVSLISDI
nr:MAG TPA: hypothetical protein [Caudoviricetes sp.]